LSELYTNNLDLYSNLTAYGHFCPTKLRIRNTEKFVSWTEENFTYVRYNPRKPIERYGLSITSLDGGLSGNPDLDSLPEYNKENNTYLHETDFNVPTPVYHYPELKVILDPIKDSLCRSHVLRIDPSGYFPPHRDYRRDVFNTFRLLIPLTNMDPPRHNFVLEDKIMRWEQGAMYFVDTARMHYLFNASFEPTYMIVINARLNTTTVNYVLNNLKYL
tara:strand:+ start:441 stop:1091 length:651 start_codon:yes stop_codon:yes gene_type:complete